MVRGQNAYSHIFDKTNYNKNKKVKKVKQQRQREKQETQEQQGQLDIAK